MPIELQIGHATETGPRSSNEDYGGFVTPDAETIALKGCLVALADGVSGGSHGREAAETTVRNLLADYYATPDTWETQHSLNSILQGINRWLLGQTASRREAGGMACTLSALAFRGRRFTLAHVGDTRIYRLRDRQLEQLSQDHVWEAPGMEHVLKRAVGLDQHLLVDFGDGELQAGDVFLIASDGVWAPLGQMELHRLLLLHDEPEFAARALVREALARDGQDNASALVVRVRAIDAEVGLAELRAARHLPLPGKLTPGARLDGFTIESVLHESRETLLYKARHIESGQVWALKTLQPRLEGDVALAERLLMEEWIAKRTQSHYLPQVLPLPARNFLYLAQSYHEGATLQAKLDAGLHFSATDTVTLGIRLLKGLAALHRLDVIHRDIKPANLHVDNEGKLRILDLGVAACPAYDSIEADAQPGTPSFMAPELLAGGNASAQSDLYAVGVTLYHLLTRKYPYGEIEPFQHPKFGEPAPPTRYRPDIPVWLENILLKACARDLAARFETAEEFLLALEQGEASRLTRPRALPLSARDPLSFWRLMTLASLILNLFLIYLLAVS
ncbi:MAG: bifunctional protein-serine/threonine kinase/phosphatase [Betaproteobacteria bacterium]|nr:bifunctional protein-serine/threonine kinase/phosphatase [Betaproteobacteria bacterium]